MSQETPKVLDLEILIAQSEVHRERVDRAEGPFKLERLEDLLAEPDPEYLIERFLKPGDLAMFYGPAKSGKTFAVVDLIAQLIKGSGHFATTFRINRPARCLYCTGEGTIAIKHRFKAAIDHHQSSQYTGENLRIMRVVPSLFDSESPKGVDAFLESLEGFQPDLVVFDTLALSMIGGDENSSTDAARLVASTLKIRDALGNPIVIFVHHSNKAGTMRGSTAFAGACDAIIQFNRPEKDLRNMQGDGMKDAEDFEPINFELQKEGETCVVRWTGRTERAKTKAERVTAQLVEFLRAVPNNEPLPVAEILKRRDFEGTTKPKLCEYLQALAANPTSVIEKEIRKLPTGQEAAHYYATE